MKDLDEVRAILKTVLAARLALPCSSVVWSLCGVVPVKLPENHDGDFDSISLVSQGNPYSRRYLAVAVAKDFGGRRRGIHDHGSRSSSRRSQAKTESQSS
jgi:hypothetical protein